MTEEKKEIKDEVTEETQTVGEESKVILNEDYDESFEDFLASKEDTDAILAAVRELVKIVGDINAKVLLKLVAVIDMFSVFSRLVNFVSNRYKAEPERDEIKPPFNEAPLNASIFLAYFAFC